MVTLVKGHGLHQASATLVDRLGVHDKSDVLEKMLAH